VALVIIDYKMPGMHGIQLIQETISFLKASNVESQDMPVFAFRYEQF
jgi:CheY-like chemotaxis protein